MGPWAPAPVWDRKPAQVAICRYLCDSYSQRAAVISVFRSSPEKASSASATASASAVPVLQLFLHDVAIAAVVITDVGT